MHEAFILCSVITPWVYSYGGNAVEYMDVAGIYFLHPPFPLRQKGGSWNGTELSSQKNLLH